MKKIISVFCIVVCTLLVSCSKSDDVKHFDVPKEVETIISNKFLTEMASHGMTINEGVNPPDIQGVFDAGIFELIYTSVKRELGEVKNITSDYRFKFYDQNGVEVKTSYTSDGDDIASGEGSIISGAKNKFTAYLRINGGSNGATYKIATIISGEISTEGIRNLEIGLCMIEKNDPDDVLMDVGTIRIWADRDKFAIRK